MLRTPVPHRSTRRAGFVLVFVLSLICVAALMTAGLARRSLSLALKVAAERDELQVRWGRASIERALLGRAEEILSARDVARERDDRAARDVRATLPLGGMTFDVLLSDEDAKANLNVLYEAGGREAVTAAVRTLRGTKSVLPIRLKPSDLTVSGLPFPPFDSWGQVFELPGQRTTAGHGRLLQAATPDMTCWGSRQLNLRRCSDAALEQVARLELSGSELEQLLRQRRDAIGNRLPIQDVLQRSGISPEKTVRLTSLLSVRSLCYSVWIDVRSKALRESTLQILEVNTSGHRHLLSFQW